MKSTKRPSGLFRKLTQSVRTTLPGQRSEKAGGENTRESAGSHSASDAGVRRLCRNPIVTVTEARGEMFAVHPDKSDVFFMDVMASGVWRLLETPMSARQITEVYLEAFPDVPPEVIEADIDRMLAQMIDESVLISSEK